MIHAGPPAEPRPLTHLVGGECVEGDSDAGDVQSNNPAHLSHPVATYRQAGLGLLGRSIEAAGSAQPAWAALGFIGRGRVLRRAAEILGRRADEVAQLMTSATLGVPG
ncbi:UNVERIFIED_ORG: acyl-CoA reductase-like NAD-dependent aldehyde dehydrogenase [Arthrobacter sp. UYCu721]